MQRLITIFLLTITPLFAFATHERAGEITFKRLSGLTYEFTITTYTYTPSPADRDSLEIKWGDGTVQIIPRSEKINFANDISRNKYVANHTFPASSIYTISMEDPNRNYGIINIPNSVNIPFYIETTLMINPFIAGNNSPILLNPPIDNGCVGVPFYHNPGAFDPDGDSLSYKIVRCKGLSGDEIPGYSIPSYTGSLSIDPYTGDFYWDSPIIQGEYNVAIAIEEYRQGVKIGSITRDMQISIGACSNHPPRIQTIADTCIEAGNLLKFMVQATDEELNQITLTATGGPLSTSNPATFNQMIGYGTIESEFSWHTNCENVRKHPFQITFKAKDNDTPINLVSMRTVRITVVSPAPIIKSVTASGNTMSVVWHKSPCQNAIGYKIYRHEGLSGWHHAYCETGVPDYTGFHLVGTTTDLNDTSYIDNNNEAGMLYGTQYCYVVIAIFPDFAESYASDEMCAALKKDVPIITNVSVTKTAVTAGRIYLAWSKPTEFDSVQYPGPYEYKVLRTETSSANYLQFLTLTNLNDTLITDSNLNTVSSAWRYKVDFYSGTTLVGSSNPATSIYLKPNASDNQAALEWSETVPWENYRFDLFRFNPSTIQWDSIGTTTDHKYVDTELSNGTEYCYYIKSTGEYTIDGITTPLINLSQEVCITPLDNTRPCAPILNGNTDCIKDYLNWHFEHDSCNSDVVKYKVYYAPNSDGFLLYDSILGNTTNAYVYQGLNTVAGCFMIEAIDSNNNASQSNYLCIDIDSCDLYRLPNVFTPNGDNINDQLHPFDYDFVERINLTIYNRWGVVVFTTENPDINWDGKEKNSHQNCSDGVYYYICDVFEYRLGGIKTRTLHGSVSLYR